MTSPAILPVLFGSGVVTEEAELLPELLSELLPEERAGIPRAAAARLLEFRGGRHCARRALGRFGLERSAVLRAPDRSPVWPAGYVGSIAHTRNRGRGFCGAAVAPAGAIRSLGLDVEFDEPLETKLWSRILTPVELAFIGEEPEEDRGFLGKLIFCAKECAYKCQYPVSRQFLEFTDVELTLPREQGELSAVLLRDAGPFRSGTAFNGRFTRQGGVIAVGMTLFA